MSSLEVAVRFVSGIVLLMANGMFVTTEFALTRLRQHDESEFQSSRTLRLAWSMTERLEIYLTACQVGITITSILLGVVFEPAVTEILHPLTGLLGLSTANTALVSITLSVVLIQFMHTVWGEQSPTYLGVEKPKQVAGFFAPVIYGWTWVTYPLIYLGDHVAKWTLSLFGITLGRSWIEEEITDKEDLRQEIDDLLSRGELPDERRQEVLNALRIDEIPTEAIMVPRQAIQAIDQRDDLEENLSRIAARGRSRFPLINGSLDETIGVLYVSALLPDLDRLRSGDIQWRDLAVEPMTVPPDLPVSELLDRFQDQQQELALVVQDDQIKGLVTTTDAAEAIIGELRDPYD